MKLILVRITTNHDHEINIIVHLKNNLNLEFFIALVPFSVTLDRHAVVSFGTTMDLDFTQLYIKNPNSAINYQAYSEPLHYITWLCIGIFCIILPPFIFFATS